MGDATGGSPIPLQASIIPSPGSYHKPLYVKKLSFAAYAKIGQSVTARYNLVVEPGLPVSPLQGGPALLLPTPRSYAVSYVESYMGTPTRT